MKVVMYNISDCFQDVYCFHISQSLLLCFTITDLSSM